MCSGETVAEGVGTGGYILWNSGFLQAASNVSQEGERGGGGGSSVAGGVGMREGIDVYVMIFAMPQDHADPKARGLREHISGCNLQ